MGYDINQNMCQRCIMNRDVDPNIVFDDEGICNHCRRYDRLVKARIYKDREKTLQKIIHRIKSKGKGKKYDCIRLLLLSSVKPTPAWARHCLPKSPIQGDRLKIVPLYGFNVVLFM